MFGVTYVFLSLASLAAWWLEPSCASGTCSDVTHISAFLGRPWWLWGALYYAAAGALCLGMPRNRLTGMFLAAGALFHAGLIAYGYAMTGSICSVCWKFAAVGVLLTVSYWVLPEKKRAWATFVSVGPVRALAVIAVTLILLNPQATVPVHGQVTKVHGVAPTNALEPEERPVNAEAAECYLTVKKQDETMVCLDLRQKPALFFAVWCPHCPAALKEAAKLEPEKRPYIVVTYMRDGDGGKVEEKLAEAGLSGEPYYLTQSPPAEVQGVPSLVWWDDVLKHVEGAEAIAEKLNTPKLLGSAEITNPPDGGGKNAEIAARLINGAVIQPGEVFSFNYAVGPRTVSRGFVEGRSVIENAYGELEAAPDVGGGVCRASTALYQAAMDAGLEIVERHEHGLPVAYAGPGKDAAVAWPYWDFRFKNTAERPLKIGVDSDGGKLKVELWLL
ncbi:MAG: VanW family protein [Firmicutes bacterium]|nr:VanW family protein [Bacillota bacterium]